MRSSFSSSSSSSSLGKSNDRLHHLYQKLQNHITEDAVVAELMVDIRGIISQAVLERTQSSRAVDRVADVYGDGWWERHSGMGSEKRSDL